MEDKAEGRMKEAKEAERERDRQKRKGKGPLGTLGDTLSGR